MRPLILLFLLHFRVPMSNNSKCHQDREIMEDEQDKHDLPLPEPASASKQSIAQSSHKTLETRETRIGQVNRNVCCTNKVCDQLTDTSVYNLPSLSSTDSRSSLINKGSILVQDIKCNLSLPIWQDQRTLVSNDCISSQGECKSENKNLCQNMRLVKPFSKSVSVSDITASLVNSDLISYRKFPCQSFSRIPKLGRSEENLENCYSNSKHTFPIKIKQQTIHIPFGCRINRHDSLQKRLTASNKKKNTLNKGQDCQIKIHPPMPKLTFTFKNAGYSHYSHLEIRKNVITRTCPEETVTTVERTTSLERFNLAPIPSQKNQHHEQLRFSTLRNSWQVIDKPVVNTRQVKEKQGYLSSYEPPLRTTSQNHKNSNKQPKLSNVVRGSSQIAKINRRNCIRWRRRSHVRRREYRRLQEMVPALRSKTSVPKVG